MMNVISSSSNVFDVQIVHSVTEIGEDAWNCLSAGQPFASYHWYRFAETILPVDSSVYIILSRGGEAVARSTFWLSRNEPLPIPQALKKILGLYFHHWPLFICRTPLVDLSGIILPAAPDLQAPALQTMAREAQAYARQKAASFLFYDYLGQVEAQLSAWPPEYFPTKAGEPSMVLTFSDANFDNYIKGLSRATKDSYRWNRNKAARSGITVQRYAKVTSIDEILVLMGNTSRHHHSYMEPWARAMLGNMDQVGAIWLAAELQGRMVSGCMFLKDGSYGILKLLARDYTVQFAYFALLYESIRCAMESGVKVLRGGSGAYSFKESFGFKEEANQYLMVTSNNPALRWIGHHLTGG